MLHQPIVYVTMPFENDFMAVAYSSEAIWPMETSVDRIRNGHCLRLAESWRATKQAVRFGSDAERNAHGELIHSLTLSIAAQVPFPNIHSFQQMLTMARSID